MWHHSIKTRDQDDLVIMITYVWQGTLETSRSHSVQSRQTHLPKTLLTFTIHQPHHPDHYQKSLDHPRGKRQQAM